MSVSLDNDFGKQFSPVVTPEDKQKTEAVLINAFGELDYSKFNDTCVKYSEDELLRKEDSTNPIKREIKRIKLSQKDQTGNNNIGSILINSTLFGTKRKKAAALQYVNKYLASTNDFPFNSVDDIKFEQINKALMGKKIKVEQTFRCMKFLSRFMHLFIVII